MSTGIEGTNAQLTQAATSLTADLTSVKRMLNQQEQTIQDTQGYVTSGNEKICQTVESFGGDITNRMVALLQSTEDLQARLHDEKTPPSAQPQLAYDMQLQLVERNERIDDLQRQLQLMTEDYAAKIGAIGAKLSEDSSVARALVTEVSVEIRERLVALLEHEKQKSSESLKQNSETTLRLEQELAAAKAQLNAITATGVHNQATIKFASEQQQDIVAHLREQVSQMQSQARVNQELQQKWKQDMSTVSEIRSQFKLLHQRMPRMEETSIKLEKAISVHEFIQSTAKYLSAEQAWVKQQLTHKGGVSGEYSQQLLETHGSQDDRVGTPYQLRVASGRDNISGPAVESADLDLSRRRVIVHSPSIEHNNGPSSRLTIEQEQLRRRAAATPRSILRQTKSDAAPSEVSSAKHVQSAGIESRDLLMMPLHGSQYNRPVMSVTGSEPQTAKGSILEQIRARLVQPERPQISWKLPALGESEKEPQSSASTGEAKLSTKRANSIDVDIPSYVTKRMRSDDFRSRTELEELNRRFGKYLDA